MFAEAAVVLDEEMRPIYWHTPPGRTAVFLPDSRALWDFLWENRERVHAVAHTHPGGGIPAPSFEDLTTFAAVEAALGKRVAWWILTRDQTSMSWWQGPDKLDYARLSVVPDATAYEWMTKLRSLGEIDGQTYC